MRIKSKLSNRVSFLHFLATLSNSEFLLEDSITFAPSSEHLIARASPIPEDEPVIQIILFFILVTNILLMYKKDKYNTFT